jgi:hypothetical protein
MNQNVTPIYRPTTLATGGTTVGTTGQLQQRWYRLALVASTSPRRKPAMSTDRTLIPIPGRSVQATA